MRTVGVKMRAVKTMDVMEVVTIYFHATNRIYKPFLSTMEVMEVIYKRFV